MPWGGSSRQGPTSSAIHRAPWLGSGVLMENRKGASLVLEWLNPIPQPPQHVTPHHPPICFWFRIPPVPLSRASSPHRLHKRLHFTQVSRHVSDSRHGKTCQGQDGVLTSTAKTISFLLAYKTRDMANSSVGRGGWRKGQLSALVTEPAGEAKPKSKQTKPDLFYFTFHHEVMTPPSGPFSLP